MWINEAWSWIQSQRNYNQLILKITKKAKITLNHKPNTKITKNYNNEESGTFSSPSLARRIAASLLLHKVFDVSSLMFPSFYSAFLTNYWASPKWSPNSLFPSSLPRVVLVFLFLILYLKNNGGLTYWLC